VIVEVTGRGCDLVVGRPGVESLFRSSEGRGCAVATTGAWCDGRAAEPVGFGLLCGNRD
jgi:hypothetical protein